jgi:hypothetical protein
METRNDAYDWIMKIKNSGETNLSGSQAIMMARDSSEGQSSMGVILPYPAAGIVGQSGLGLGLGARACRRISDPDNSHESIAVDDEYDDDRRLAKPGSNQALFSTRCARSHRPGFTPNVEGSVDVQILKLSNEIPLFNITLNFFFGDPMRRSATRGLAENPAFELHRTAETCGMDFAIRCDEFGEPA